MTASTLSFRCGGWRDGACQRSDQDREVRLPGHLADLCPAIPFVTAVDLDQQSSAVDRRSADRLGDHLGQAASAKPPRASWIGGVSDVRPRSISFASSNQLTLLTNSTCDGIGRTPDGAIRSRWLSPRLTEGRAAIGSPRETVQSVSKSGSGIHNGGLPGRERVFLAQMTMGKSSRSASCLICDGASLRLSAGDERNSLPRSIRFADWASSTISTSGPEARSTASSPRLRENIRNSAGAHQSPTSMLTNHLAIPSSDALRRSTNGRCFEPRMMSGCAVKLNYYSSMFLPTLPIGPGISAGSGSTGASGSDRPQIETGKSGRSPRARICGNDNRRSTASYEIYSLDRSGSGHAIALPTISSSGPRVSWRCGSAAEIGRRQRHTPERQFMSVISGNVSGKHRLLLTGLYVIGTDPEYRQSGSLFPDWDTTCVPFGRSEGAATDV